MKHTTKPGLPKAYVRTVVRALIGHRLKPTVTYKSKTYTQIFARQSFGTTPLIHLD